MYKPIILIILTLLVKTNLCAQLVDRAPTGEKNRLPVEGGGITMKIDSLTPLPRLINKLNGSWEFIETGKAYWIGYTNDMFSIASRGDDAVPALANFFKTTKSESGKIGVIYTLHLIGIDRQIVGRFIERFVDSSARFTLLQLLSEHEYTRDIIELLMRDPWQSDIPYLLDILQTETDNKITWPIVNALCRYRIPELPYNNKLPKSIENLVVSLNVKDENILEHDFDFNAQIKEALKEFKNQYPRLVIVDSTLYSDNLSPYYKTKLSSKLSIGGLLSSLNINRSPFGFSRIGCKLQYYYEDEALHFCTIQTAQRRLNTWWSHLPKDGKEKLK